MQIPSTIIESAITVLRNQGLPYSPFTGWRRCDYAPVWNGVKLSFGGHFKDNNLRKLEVKGYDVTTNELIYDFPIPVN